jgi:hypothetical protein
MPKLQEQRSSTLYLSKLWILQRTFLQDSGNRSLNKLPFVLVKIKIELYNSQNIITLSEDLNERIATEC